MLLLFCFGSRAPSLSLVCGRGARQTTDNGLTYPSHNPHKVLDGFYADAYADDVVFVDLSALRDSALVAAIIAQVMGLRESGRQSAHAALAVRPQARRPLLALDNFSAHTR